MAFPVIKSLLTELHFQIEELERCAEANHGLSASHGQCQTQEECEPMMNMLREHHQKPRDTLMKASASSAKPGAVPSVGSCQSFKVEIGREDEKKPGVACPCPQTLQGDDGSEGEKLCNNTILENHQTDSWEMLNPVQCREDEKTLGVTCPFPQTLQGDDRSEGEKLCNNSTPLNDQTGVPEILNPDQFRSGSTSSALQASSTWIAAAQSSTSPMVITNAGVDSKDLHRHELFGKAPKKHDSYLEKLDSIIMSVIVCNTIVMAVNCQWLGYTSKQALGIEQDTSRWRNAKNTFDILEHIFNIIFILELLLRMFIAKHHFLFDVASIFDSCLVTISSLELYVFSSMGHGKGGNITILRLLRLFSLEAVAWAIALLGCCIMIGSIFLCQMLNDFILDESEPEELRLWAFTRYGSFTRSMNTMFEATLSGCWPNYSSRLILDISNWYVCFWVVYVILVVFAITRIISAIFLKETLNVADQQGDMIIYEKSHKLAKYEEKLKKLFKAADRDGDGFLNRAEFVAVLDHPQVRLYLQSLELEAFEVAALFNLIDDGDGRIYFEEFVKGVLHLKGQARCVDVVAILNDVEKIRKEVEEINATLSQSMHSTGRI